MSINIKFRNDESFSCSISTTVKVNKKQIKAFNALDLETREKIFSAIGKQSVINSRVRKLSGATKALSVLEAVIVRTISGIDIFTLKTRALTKIASNPTYLDLFRKAVNDHRVKTNTPIKSFLSPQVLRVFSNKNGYNTESASINIKTIDEINEQFNDVFDKQEVLDKAIGQAENFVLNVLELEPHSTSNNKKNTENYEVESEDNDEKSSDSYEVESEEFTSSSSRSTKKRTQPEELEERPSKKPRPTYDNNNVSSSVEVNSLPDNSQTPPAFPTSEKDGSTEFFNGIESSNENDAGVSGIGDVSPEIPHKDVSDSLPKSPERSASFIEAPSEVASGGFLTLEDDGIDPLVEPEIQNFNVLDVSSIDSRNGIDYGYNRENG